MSLMPNGLSKHVLLNFFDLLLILDKPTIHFSTRYKMCTVFANVSIFYIYKIQTGVFIF